MKNKNKQTRFPVARIKRIMQKDEEVGKVAQATPVVISKALEMFLGMIVDEASRVTTDRGSKKVEAYHLKHAIETVDVLDFLKEIVEAVPDPSAGGTIDLAAEAAEKAAAKKRSKGKRPLAAGDGETAAPVRRRRKKEDMDTSQDKSTINSLLNPAEDDEEGEDEEGENGYDGDRIGHDGAEREDWER